MSDSFLEDLGLISTKEETEMTYNQQRDRHVTTRRTTSPPSLLISKQDEKNDIMQVQKERPLIPACMPIIKINYNKEDYSSKDFIRQLDQKINNNEQQTTSEISQVKLQEKKFKITDNKIPNIQRNQRSGSYKKSDVLSIPSKENKHSPDSSKNHSSDIFNKENSHRSNSSKENVCDDLIQKKEKFLDSKEVDFKIQDKDLLLFTAIKDVIKQENDRNLRAMQQLHMNSQATLIKSFLNQTDELIQTLRSNKDFTMEKLIDDNRRMQEELIVLQTEKKNLQSKLEEIEALNKKSDH